MKIDVEGMELHVLLGSQSTIKKHQPIILLEQLESEFQSPSAETPSIKILRDLGYRFCWIKQEHHKSNWLNLLKPLGKRKVAYDIVTDQLVPKATYDMLIALPPKYAHILDSNV